MDTSSQTLKQEQPVVHLTSGDAAVESQVRRPSRAGLLVCTILFIPALAFAIWAEREMILHIDAIDANGLGMIGMFVVKLEAAVFLGMVWLITFLLAMSKKFWWISIAYSALFLSFIIVLMFDTAFIRDVGVSLLVCDGAMWIVLSIYLLFSRSPKQHLI